MQITDKFEVVPVAEIQPDEHNARKHSDEQIQELRRSLREFGFVNPLLIDKNKKIIAGHGRLVAAIAEGMEAVPCIFVEHLTEAQRRAYMLADNRLAEHATWDIALLNEELKFLDDLGFDMQNGRTCYMLEYDPRYVDVIIDRWEKFTGESAVLL